MSFAQKRLKFVESTGTIRAEKEKFTDKRFTGIAKRSMLRFRRARYLWNRKKCEKTKGDEPMKKKLLTVALCAVMAAAMAVPAFADWTLEPAYPAHVSSNALNIYGNTGTFMQKRPLTLWTKMSSIDQQFTVTFTTYNGSKCMYLTRVQNGKTYAINRSLNSVAGGKAAIMWDLNTGARDSAFQMPYPDETRLVNLLNYNEGLRYSGDYSGATVYFAPGGSSAWIASGSPAL